LGWSLDHEIFFYSIIAISLLVIPANKKSFSGVVFFLIIAISHLIPRTHNLHINYRLEFLGASINYEFLLGFLIFKFKDAILPFFRLNVVWVFSTCLFIILLLTIKEEHIVSHYKGNYFRDYIIITKTGYVIHRFWICGISCMLIFLSLLARENDLKRFHKSFLVEIGDASFSVYLLHGAFLTILPTFILGSLWLRIALCIASLILSLKAVRMESFVGNHAKQYLSKFLHKNGKSIVNSASVKNEGSEVINAVKHKKTAI
jgi:peptidoglycan/LPS O-acetylase OafA/YrhL